ncbi:MAG: DUF1460 domain-containing protein [Rikenellaceae bacterium]|nr:DUF1460 domain-containing protein [Rikenellaceae bacterium]
MKLFFLTFLSSILLGTTTQEPEYNIYYTDEDVEIFNEYISEFYDSRNEPIGELIVETGKYFLDTPYVGFTLEAREPEELIVNLRELDCVTFVESTIALVQTLKSDNPTFENYCVNLKNLRYRQGELKDFTSRLHYFSDWIWDKQEMGILQDYTKELGGDPYPVHPKIMSKYPHKYRQLVNNPEFIPVMSEIEDQMKDRDLYAVPQAKAGKLDDKLENGMVIGMTTNTAMDIAHVGFICYVDGKPHFMHASSEHKKVILTDYTIEDYLKRVKAMTGFMAAKVNDTALADTVMIANNVK